MSYLQCSDDETVDSANKVSRFSYESQCEVKQGATGGQSSTLSNDDTFQVRTLSVTHWHGILMCEYFQTQAFLHIL